MSLTLGYASTLGTGSPSGYPFDDVFDEVRQVTPEQIFNREVDALVLWGGADISPSIYKAQVSKRNQAGPDLSQRDQIETALFNAAQAVGIPVIGVCRGAQLVCAMSGGLLVQDVQNHSGDHMMDTVCGLQMETTSIHHQMMYPFNMPKDSWDLLAWTAGKLSVTYVLDDEDVRTNIPCEPEVVWFPQTKSLAIQGHPEFAPSTSDFVQYTLRLVRKLILPEIVK